VKKSGKWSSFVISEEGPGSIERKWGSFKNTSLFSMRKTLLSRGGQTNIAEKREDTRTAPEEQHYEETQCLLRRNDLPTGPRKEAKDGDAEKRRHSSYLRKGPLRRGRADPHQRGTE